MPSLSSKDRVSLCRFTFDDGRRCLTPRISTSANFCFYHAQKEAQFRASESISDDLAYFFSGDYLSANDLNIALSRVFLAVARGDLKPRAARALAYLAQTMLQTLHLAQNEFITACGEKDWRNTVVQSINANHAYRFPESTEPAPPQTAAPAQPPTPPPTPASTPVQSASLSPQSSAPATAEIRPAPAAAPIPTPAPHANSSPVGAGLARPEPPSTLAASQPTAEPNQPATQTPNNPPATQSAPPPRPTTQTRDPYAVHYGPNYRLIVDGKPF